MPFFQKGDIRISLRIGTVIAQRSRKLITNVLRSSSNKALRACHGWAAG